MTASALPDLVDRWIAGFSTARGVAWRRTGTLVEVDVDAESRRLELVLVEPDDALVRSTIARLVGTDDVWSTVFTTTRRPLDVPAGVRVRLDDEVLMTRALTDPEVPAAPRVDLVVEGARATATVRAGSVVAAEGVVAVVGADATFDRIRTHDDHRRRGLGTEVMTALTGWARSRGASVGLLAASAEGQHLYSRLGWQVAGQMTTFAGTGLPSGPPS